MQRLPLAVFVCALFPMVTPSVAAQDLPDFREEFLGQFNYSAERVVALAQAMPAATYSWQPSEGAASVVRAYMHIAHYNYMYLEDNLGLPRPAGIEHETWEDGVTDKAQAVELLSASMEYVRQAVKSLSDSALDESTQLYGRDVAKWAVLLQLVAHMNEHLGQEIAYARMNGIVPPWSN